MGLDVICETTIEIFCERCGKPVRAVFERPRVRWPGDAVGKVFVTPCESCEEAAAETAVEAERRG